MATKASRPGRRLIAFGVVIAALYGGVALGGEWQPKLGLDLQGGTSITLEAQTPSGDKPPKSQLDEARGIIDQRVNGTGVAEAEVATQGDRNIVVEVPGSNPKGLVDTVKQTAQLRFRLVALSAPGTAAAVPERVPERQRLLLDQPLGDAERQGHRLAAERQPQGPCRLRRPGVGRQGQEAQGQQDARPRRRPRRRPPRRRRPRRPPSRARRSPTR